MVSQTSDVIERPCRVGFFATKAKAERAVRDLMAAGFTNNELAIICPTEAHHPLSLNVPRAEPPCSHGAEALAEGGAIGAAIGGIALAATAILTGGTALLPAIPVALGGGAIAGGFSNIIMSDGYGKGVGEFYLDALHKGKIAVGVEVEDQDSAARLAEADRILARAGADSTHSRKNQVPRRRKNHETNNERLDPQGRTGWVKILTQG
jgi:hypothetical protein